MEEFVGKFCNVKLEWTEEVRGRDLYRGREWINVEVISVDETKMVIDAHIKPVEKTLQELDLKLITNIEVYKVPAKTKKKKDILNFIQTA